MNRTLALTLLALAGATGAAQAGNCPRGQIYRVSKHVCVDRDEAVKLGIVRGPAIDADKAKPAEAAQEPERRQPRQPVARQETAAPEPPALAEPAAEPADAEATPKAARQVKTVRTVRITRPGAPVPPTPQASPPVKAEASAASPSSPFGALEPGGVPMSQPR